MSVSVSRNTSLPVAPRPEEAMPMMKGEKQGIVSILGSDWGEPGAPSLRRTLSADMSSMKWLAAAGKDLSSSATDKASSREEHASPAADSLLEEDKYEVATIGKDELDRPNQSEVWMAIQSEKKPGQTDVWGSILSQKPEEQSSLPPPYVHPLVKRSASSLSEKSLEICTESLGSETGSDGFSSENSSDVDEEKEEAKQMQQNEEEEEKQFVPFNKEEEKIPKSSNHYCLKKNYSFSASPRSFPPPLPSRIRGDGPSLQMHSLRRNGRLVLEAVTILPRNSFRAQRQDGRLFLTLVCNTREEEDDYDDDDDEDDEEEEEPSRGEMEESAMEDESKEKMNEDEKAMELVEVNKDQKAMEVVIEEPAKLTSGVALMMMKKLMNIGNRKVAWPHELNKAVKLVELGGEVEEDACKELRRSIPQPPPPRLPRLIQSPNSTSPPPPPSPASFNAKDYIWRTKPAVVASILGPIKGQQCTNVKNSMSMCENQELVVMRGNHGNYLVPLFRGCKENRRSLLIWEPYCIATS